MSMYKHGIFCKFQDGRIECTLEGVDFSFWDMSNATQKYIRKRIRNGLSGGPIFEISYPSDENPKEDLKTLLERRREIKKLLQSTDSAVFEVCDLEYELEQIEDILDDYTIANVLSDRGSRLLFVGNTELSDMARKQLIYCNCHENREETDEEIIKAISSDYLVCKFEGDALNCDKNDILSRVNYVDFSKTYITKHIDAGIRVWEVCGRVTDMEDAVIPHAYYVRHIGSLIEITERGDQKDA